MSQNQKNSTELSLYFILSQKNLPNVRKNCYRINAYLNQVTKSNQQLDQLKQITSASEKIVEETKQAISQRKPSNFQKWVQINQEVMKTDHKTQMSNIFYDYKRCRKINPPPIHQVMNKLMENSPQKFLETQESSRSKVPSNTIRSHRIISVNLDKKKTQSQLTRNKCNSQISIRNKINKNDDQDLVLQLKNLIKKF